MPSLFHSPARVISEAAVFPCWFLLDQLCYQFCKLPLFTPPIKSRPEASCLQRNHIGSAIVLMRAISEFFSASRRVEFVTFSAVNKRKKKKNPGWDTLFISSEEGEEGTANVVWSRQFQDAPGPEETGTKEFCFFPPVYHVCVFVYMREPVCTPFVDVIISSTACIAQAGDASACVCVHVYSMCLALAGLTRL